MANFSFLENYKLIKSQFAEDGKWEDATELNFCDENPILEKNRSQDTAIEFFLSNKNNDICFIGFRLAQYSFVKQNQIISDCLTNLKTKQSFEDVRSTIGKVINIDNFVSSSPDFLEIGAEGFWKTYGSQIVWRANDIKPLDIKDIKTKAPQLLDSFKRPMMMEVAWKKPMSTWLALQVSDRTGNNLFCFSQRRYEHYLEKVINND